MSVVALAGLGKLLDLGEFRQSLDTWTLIPSSVRDVVCIGIPCVEVVLATCWYLGICRHVAQWVTLVLLAAMCSAAVLHLAAQVEPKCSCLGLLNSYFKTMQTGRAIVAKSAILTIVLGLGMAIEGGVRKPRPTKALKEPR